MLNRTSRGLQAENLTPEVEQAREVVKDAVVNLWNSSDGMTMQSLKAVYDDIQRCIHGYMIELDET